jgi:hypothetical protein
VLTPQNRAEVLPRFFHQSKQEAKAIAAELLPDPNPPRRTVVTRVEAHRTNAAPAPEETASQTVLLDEPRGLDESTNSAAEDWKAPRVLMPEPIALERPRSVRAEPLTATETRLHLTVSPEFLEKLEAARLALSHARPGATVEDVLTAGLDLVLAKDAKRKALVKSPRTTEASTIPATEPERNPDHIPAAVRREVWARDEGKCQWPLDGGGVCGSRLRTELDHIKLKCKGGRPTVENIRVLCELHNQLAAREQLGNEVMDAYARNPRQAALFD